MSKHNLDFINDVVARDTEALRKAFKSYGDSWCARGGVGAFMMLARKWDRLENFVKSLSARFAGASDWDVFRAIREDRRPEGIIDDIRDLRRYLILVEAEMMAQGVITPEVLKDIEVRVENLAKVGFFRGDVTTGLIGEGGAEAVLPLSKGSEAGHAQPHPRGFDPSLDGSKKVDEDPGHWPKTPRQE